MYLSTVSSVSSLHVLLVEIAHSVVCCVYPYVCPQAFFISVFGVHLGIGFGLEHGRGVNTEGLWNKYMHSVPGVILRKGCFPTRERCVMTMEVLLFPVSARLLSSVGGPEYGLTCCFPSQCIRLSVSDISQNPSPHSTTASPLALTPLLPPPAVRVKERSYPQGNSPRGIGRQGHCGRPYRDPTEQKRRKTALVTNLISAKCRVQTAEPLGRTA